jgi:hypothetical protein
LQRDYTVEEVEYRQEVGGELVSVIQSRSSRQLKKIAELRNRERYENRRELRSGRGLREGQRRESVNENYSLLKGQCHKIFDFRLFHESSSHKSLK